MQKTVGDNHNSVRHGTCVLNCLESPKRDFAAIHGHELRRVSVWRKAYLKYAKPWSEKGSEALKCGIICRSKPGQARKELQRYLDRNRLVVQWQFLDKNRAGDDTWATEQQLSITDELSYSDTVNGIMVGIKPEGIHVVGSPPDVAWKPCPK